MNHKFFISIIILGMVIDRIGGYSPYLKVGPPMANGANHISCAIVPRDPYDKRNKDSISAEIVLDGQDLSDENHS